jgi:type VI secretion system protein ImpI
MELVFEVVGTQQFAPGLQTTKTFKRAGGVIGRAEDCDWVIPDRKRVVSGRHAQVSYREGAFYLTDTSSNGIQLKNSGAQLAKGEPQRIEHGHVYRLGDYELRARLIQDPSSFEGGLGRPQVAGSIIPDDAFLELDPVAALEQQDRTHSEVEGLSLLTRSEPAPPQVDYARIDMENLPLPELVSPPAPSEPRSAAQPERLPAGFWERFGEALELPLEALGEDERQQLALQAARLLGQCVGGLQQSLRTRSELKNEMRLALTTTQNAGNNPLKHSPDGRSALAALLRGGIAGQLPAEQAIGRAFRDLQAHQVALLAATRAAMKGLLEQLAPERLSLRFEREHKPLLTTDAGRWRAYRRLHQRLQQDDEWSERLFARDFAQAYEEQVRLIGTLDSNPQG